MLLDYEIMGYTSHTYTKLCDRLAKKNANAHLAKTSDITSVTIQNALIDACMRTRTDRETQPGSRES